MMLALMMLALMMLALMMVVVFLRTMRGAAGGRWRASLEAARSEEDDNTKPTDKLKHLKPIQNQAKTNLDAMVIKNTNTPHTTTTTTTTTTTNTHRLSVCLLWNLM